jgi:histidine triad (HIT) family protein
MSCVFCAIAAGTSAADRVLEDERFVAFLDARPVFLGHVLLIPKPHIATLLELPPDLHADFLGHAQHIARAVVEALGADGTFVAMNNVVSQSVPHLHLHIVPRRKKDGLRGFFWPRQKYASSEAQREYAARISRALES